MQATHTPYLIASVVAACSAQASEEKKKTVGNRQRQKEKRCISDMKLLPVSILPAAAETHCIQNTFSPSTFTTLCSGNKLK